MVTIRFIELGTSKHLGDRQLDHIPRVQDVVLLGKEEGFWQVKTVLWDLDFDRPDDPLLHMVVQKIDYVELPGILDS